MDIQGSSFLPPPPPYFDLPLPPRPSWFEDLDECFDLLESCDNTIVMTANFQDSFHSAAIILVSSFLFVVFILLSVFVFFFRKRKNTLSSYGNCHQITDSSALYDSPILSRRKPSLKNVSGSGDTLHLDSHFPNSTSLPNHYIQESEKNRRCFASRPLEPHFSTSENRTVMQLSSVPPERLSSDNFPHILIGGTPFYLIPSSSSRSRSSGGESSAVIHQHHPNSGGLPIYEEIDKRAFDEESTTYSDRVEVGSESELRSNTPILQSSSIYYYSDTLRNSSTAKQQLFSSRILKVSDDSDSGISNPSLPKDTTVTLPFTKSHLSTHL